MAACPFVVRPVDWPASREALRAVRRAVFIEEQGVPEELEWDDLDELSVHLLATSRAGEAIGTGRLTPDGRIGRMAVVREWRSRGVGGEILKQLIDLARRQDFAQVRLHAQTHALGFYARYGFVAFGAQFEEAGIPHRTMALKLER